MILGQDIFNVFQTLEYFETDQKGTSIAVRLPLGWVLNGPLPSTSGIFYTGFKIVTQIENDFDFANEI